MCDPSVGNTGYFVQQIKPNIVWLILIVYIVLFLMVWSVQYFKSLSNTLLPTDCTLSSYRGRLG